MSEEDKVFSSTVKNDGIFNFKDFYKFCYDWLIDETRITDFSEDKYGEKLTGDSKDIDVEWVAQRKLTDYFKEKIKVRFKIRRMSQVKVRQEGADVETNKGSVEIKVDGILVKDYEGKFEMTGFRKFLRSVYEKYVIPSSVEDFQEKVAVECNTFLEQAKAFLDLEGKTG